MAMTAIRLAALSLLLPACALAQEAAPGYVFEGWSAAQGLPVNAVTDLAQTADGYLWIATFDGLVRFDGARFTVFNVGNTAALPSNRILQLDAGRDGSLWIQTTPNHLVRYRHHTFTPAGPPLEGRVLSVFYEDARGVAWVGTDAGLFRAEGKAFRAVPVGNRPRAITALVSDSSGTLWVGTPEGLWHLPGGGAAAPVSGAADLVTALGVGAAGTVWIGTPGGVHRLGGKGASARDAGPHATTHLVSTGNRLLATSDAGVYRYGGSAWRQMEGVAAPPLYTHDPIQPDRQGGYWLAAGTDLYHDDQRVFRAPSAIRAFLLDPEGSVWVGTDRSGLYRLRPTSFQVYSTPEGLAAPNVLTVAEDAEGALWIGSSGGLSRLRNGRAERFGAAHGLPSNPIVRSLFVDRAGTLWLGHDWGLMARTGERFAQVGDPQGPAQARVHAIYQTSDGALWVGTSQGLYRRHEGAWARFTTRDGLAHDYVRAFVETRDGTLWMGTNGGGLSAYRGGRFSNFTTGEGLSSNLVRALYEDANGTLWVGTEGRGLDRVETSEGTVRRVTPVRQHDGLFDEGIHVILEDAQRRLWMSTNRGIFWVRRAELDAFAAGEVPRVHATAYTEADGLRNREANGGTQPAGLRARDGRLWFATQDGAAVIDPSRMRPNPVPPPLVIEQVVVPDTAFHADAPVRLGTGQRSFEIRYTALSFTAPQNVRFRYRLEGFDRGWVEAGTRRVAYYTNVPPGRYVFHLQAANNDGVWSRQDATLRLGVAPFFYETAWFLIGCVLALMALWLLLSGLRVRRLRRRKVELEALVATRTEALSAEQARTADALATVAAQAEKLQRLDEAKSRFFANVSHEFRTPLTLVIGPLRSALAGAYGPTTETLRAQHQLMLRNSRRLLRLINEVLDLARLEADGLPLERRPLDLGPFVRRVVEAFGPLAERQRIGLHFSDPDASCPVLADAEALEKVVGNLLSNAVKFTGAGGHVGVALRVREGMAEIAVADSGPGIPASDLPHVFDRFYRSDAPGTPRREGAGIGLALAKELAELHGGTIQAESAPGEGSTFTVRLPLAALQGVLPAGDGRAYDAPELPDGGLAEPLPSAADAEDRTTVLVVEDHADVRAYLRTLLEPAYRVLEAPDGAAGLATARAHLPDLILADVMMPEMDGFTLNRALKADAALDGIPVILLTARGAPEDQVAGLATGPDDYVTKPFEPDVLVAKVHNLIALRQRLRVQVRRDLARTLGLPAEAAGFEAEVRHAIEARFTDPEFGVEALADVLALSYTQLYRRLRDEGAATPSDLIRTVRLEQAARLLRSQAGNVSEVAYAVGFNSVAHFSRSFRAHFGQAPSMYAAQAKEGRLV